MDRDSTMSPLVYHRPKTIEEAIVLLERGVPLAGGTALTPVRSGLEAAIDLQELSLDTLYAQDGIVHAGASLKLQALVEAEAFVPEMLKAACRLEASWNLRNMATLGGSAMTLDGRSPLLTALLALEPTVQLEPGDHVVTLDELLDMREQHPFHRLITEIRFAAPVDLRYEQVSRTPADRPLVCAAVARFSGSGPEQSIHVALGGFGKRPVLAVQADDASLQGAGVDAATKAARESYRDAGDHWASAAYRSHIAGVLVRRLLTAGG
jgi:carbon-monoxide dehydrogenase medium subunit